MSNQLPVVGRWLTVREAAEVLGINQWTIYEMVRKNQIGHRRVGRSIRIDPRDAYPVMQAASAKEKGLDMAVVSQQLGFAMEMLKQVQEALSKEVGS